MNAVDRSKLDEAVKVLTDLSGGLNLDDFRLSQQKIAKKTVVRIRLWVILFSVIFLGIAFYDLYIAAYPPDIGSNRPVFVYAALWAVALGGLGAITSIFLDVLKLIPQQTLRSSDEFEVIVRIILGVLFSFVISLTIVSSEVTTFFRDMPTSAGPKQGAVLLLPFLAGYSLSLVLSLLEKTIKAIEMTIGIEDRRTDAKLNQQSISKRRRL